MTTPAIDERETVTSALKTLLEDGIIKPLQAFHAHAAKLEQTRRITKATVEPQLKQAAARIAAVVEAERPINYSTIKGLINVDVDKSTDELRRRIQSLKAKLGETNMLKRTAATSGDTAMLQKKKAKNAEGNGKKSNKTPGTAVAHTTVIPNKNKTWNKTATAPTTTKKPWGNPTGNGKKPWGTPAGNGKKPWGTPAGNGGASTNTNKTGEGATGRKPVGRKEGRQTVANN